LLCSPTLILTVVLSVAYVWQPRLIIFVDSQADGDFDAVLTVFGQRETSEPTDRLADPFHDSYVPLRRAFYDA
jgi:hypothetical protein